MKELYLGKKLKIISNQITRKIDSKVTNIGLDISSSQARIISYLNRETGLRDVYQKDIEEEFNIRRASATNTLQNLEKNGYIRRESVIKDARLKKIILTEKGISINETLFMQIKDVEHSLLELFSEDEYKQLNSLLDKLALSFSKEKNK